jgi:hypothetical protein
MIDTAALASQQNDLDIQTLKTQNVLQHHFDASYSGDLDAVMEDFTEQSILVTEEASFVGLKAIGNFYLSLLQLFSKGVVDYKLKKVVVVKNIAYITWQLKTPDLDIPFGTDTFIIENDKILYQTAGTYVIPFEKNKGVRAAQNS